MSRKQPSRYSHGRGAWAFLLLALLAVGGCDTMFMQSGQGGTGPAHPGDDTARNGDGDDGRHEVAAYLNFMGVLDSSDEQGWHTIFQHTLTAFQNDPTRAHRMRFALAMSRADVKAAEPRITRNMLTDSRKLLEETLTEPVSPPPLVRKFTQLMLTEIDARLALYDELRSLRSQLAKAHQASQTANRDRTEAEARMRRIDAALAEANAKLEAVMKIERKIAPTGKETFP